MQSKYIYLFSIREDSSDQTSHFMIMVVHGVPPFSPMTVKMLFFANQFFRDNILDVKLSWMFVFEYVQFNNWDCKSTFIAERTFLALLAETT